jgi:hypothetical protein
MLMQRLLKMSITCSSSVGAAQTALCILRECDTSAFCSDGRRHSVLSCHRIAPPVVITIVSCSVCEVPFEINVSVVS